MSMRYNNGIIYTDEGCVGCNKCVHTCPTIGANVSTRISNKICSVVSDKDCIHCGRCVTDCAHKARHFKDDTEEVLKALSEGEEIYALIDPTVYLAFCDNYANVFGYLMSLGIKGILDGSVGGQICLYEHVKYLKEHMDEDGNCDKFIAHNCAGISNYVSKYVPRAADFFVPVKSPGMCAAVYFKKYENIKGKIVYITSCTAVYDEINSYSSGRCINYFVGISSVMDLIRGVDISGFSSEADCFKDKIGMSIIEAGKFVSTAAAFFDAGTRFNSYKGFDDDIDRFFETDAFYESGIHSVLIEMSSCNKGCVSGPAFSMKDYDIHKGFAAYSQACDKITEVLGSNLLPDERFKIMSDRFAYLDDEDFAWECEDNYIQHCRIPEDVIDEIFNSMFKLSEQKRHFDCGACGHKSCLDMVIAVANGFSRIEDCVHYMNDDMRARLGIDSMTGLSNRNAFIQAGEKLLLDNRDEKYVLVIGDINGLGGVNDLYGNAGGDAVIKYVADVVRDYCAGRGICARLGGGSFGMLIVYSDKNRERFAPAFSLNVEHLGIEYPLTIKFGIYEITDHGITMNKAIMYATYAYRCAIDKSRNTYTFYTEKMAETMFKESEVTQKMRSAMDNGEFVLYLQPKYDHITGKLAGAEVLSRWVKEDGSLVSPGIFIPVFEKNGFIDELDRYVWKSTFKLIDKWIDAGIEVVPVSVNISRISLTDQDVVDYIRELDEEFPKVKPYIQFEITESAYVGGEHNIFDKISKLREMGFLINMDDFGSGYSSLNTLKDAPIDVLKLDMGFLRGGKNVEKGNIIISSVVDMAKQLGLNMVAEGVETKDQADMLTNMGCNIIQGFYYARPMPVKDFENLF